MRVEIDIRSSPMTLGEAVSWVEAQSLAHPEREYFMDGDAYAIVSKPR